MRTLYELLHRVVDVDWLMEHTERLWRLELGQRSSDYRRAARYAERLLRQSGFSTVERIEFPADGRTTYQDTTTPLAWDATMGRLTVLRSPVWVGDPVVAGYARHPFHLIKGSVSTPKGGCVARLVTERQMDLGADVRGAMVLGERDTAPRHPLFAAAGRRGALGVVTDFLPARRLTPDAVHWVNAGTQWLNWHVQADDGPFVGFAVSPRTGDRLRAACNKGEVTVRVECDGRRHLGKVDVVTGVIPGREKRELWLLAHLYEPLPDDNSSGVVAAIEIGRAIRRLVERGELPRPRFTLRVVFGLEFYGFGAYVARRGGRLKDQAVGAMSIDGLPFTDGCETTAITAPSGSPFFGDYLWEQFAAFAPKVGWNVDRLQEGYYGDDMAQNDPTVGLSTVWMDVKPRLWHNSAQRMEIIRPEAFRRAAALLGAWTARMLTLERRSTAEVLETCEAYARKHVGAEAACLLEAAAKAPDPSAPKRAQWAMAARLDREVRRLRDFARIAPAQAVEKAVTRLRREARGVARDLVARVRRAVKGAPTRPADPERARWEKIADLMVCARVGQGFPHDLRRIPADRRPIVPDAGIYGPFPFVVALMDGKRTLKEVFELAEWETRTVFSPAQMEQYVKAIRELSEYGYFRTRYRRGLSKRRPARRSAGAARP